MHLFPQNNLVAGARLEEVRVVAVLDRRDKDNSIAFPKEMHFSPFFDPPEPKGRRKQLFFLSREGARMWSCL